MEEICSENPDKCTSILNEMKTIHINSSVLFMCKTILDFLDRWYVQQQLRNNISSKLTSIAEVYKDMRDLCYHMPDTHCGDLGIWCTA